MRLVLGLCFAALLLVPTGCSTMNQIHAQIEGPAAFGGVRYTMARWHKPDLTPGEHASMVFDLPFSFALDALILPFSAINEIVENGIDVVDSDPAIERRDTRVYNDRTRPR